MYSTKTHILQRIEEIKEYSSDCYYDGFDKRNGRWTHLNVEGVHISKVDFSLLANDQLVHIFEQIIRRFYTQR